MSMHFNRPWKASRSSSCKGTYKSSKQCMMPYVCNLVAQKLLSIRLGRYNKEIIRSQIQVSTSSAQYLKRTGLSLRQHTAVFKRSLISGLSLSPSFLHSAWTHLDTWEQTDKDFLGNLMGHNLWCAPVENRILWHLQYFLTL